MKEEFEGMFPKYKLEGFYSAIDSPEGKNLIIYYGMLRADHKLILKDIIKDEIRKIEEKFEVLFIILSLFFLINVIFLGIMNLIKY